MLFGLTNYFVVNFRGSPIVPWDLLIILVQPFLLRTIMTFTLSWKAAASVLHVYLDDPDRPQNHLSHFGTGKSAARDRSCLA